MAHAKSTNAESTLLREIDRGYRSRRIQKVNLIIASARTSMAAPANALADAIISETIQKSIMVAPCAGKILRVTTNALTWPINAGTITVDVKKAVIGAGDQSVLSAALSVENTGAVRVAETAFDASLNATATNLQFVEGQLIYAEVAISANGITTASIGLIVEIEWVPSER
jgi:hypothetical protein